MQTPESGNESTGGVMTGSEKPWHVDKTIPLAFIFALLMQAVGGVWFMSRLSSNIEQIVREQSSQDARLRVVEQSTQAQAIAGATFTNQIANITDTLGQIRQDQRSQIELLRQVLEGKP